MTGLPRSSPLTPHAWTRRSWSCSAAPDERLHRMMGDVAECRQSLSDVVELFGERWSGSGSSETIDVERFSDRGRLRRWLGDVAPLNRRDLLMMRPYFPSIEVLRDSLALDLDAIGRGVRFRLIAATTAARRPGVSHYLDALQEAGAEIRVATSVPLYLLILDGAVIVTPSPQAEAPGDLVIRSGLVSGCLTEMFEHSWVGGADYSGTDEPAACPTLISGCCGCWPPVPPTRRSRGPSAAPTGPCAAWSRGC